MRDPSQEADLLKSLSDAYQEICEIAVLRQGGDQQTSPKEKRPVGMGGKGFHGKVYGLGADKKEKNDPKADDRRAKRQKDQAREDRRQEARDRAARGEDKYSKMIKKVQDED